jgi:hypothetical protein
VAYPYWENTMAPIIQSVQSKFRLLIDSGAFTVWKQDSTIDKKDYADFIDNLSIKPWRYFSLDVIGDVQRTQENLNWFFANGFTPTPVFQRGEDFKLLPKYAEYTGMVGLGLGVHSKGSMNYLRETMKHTNGVNVHWLGVTRPPWITYYKPYSVDTTQVWCGRRWGRLMLYDRGRLIPWHRSPLKNSSMTYQKPSKKISDLMKRYGGEPSMFQYPESWTGGESLAHIVTTRSWVTYCREVERRFGTKIFLGCICTQDIQTLIDTWNWCEENNL